MPVYFNNKTFTFFKNLKQNNTKEWFADHRSDFVSHVQEPAQVFVEDFGKMLRKLDKRTMYDTRTNGSGSMFRIYRDVRFSKNKIPYKTNLGMLFWLNVYPKKTDNPGYYVEVNEQGGRVFAGHYRFGKEQLYAYRESIVDSKKAKQLNDIYKKLEAEGYQVEQPFYKRLPANFDSDYKYPELAKCNAVTGRTLSVISKKTVTSEGFATECFDHCETMTPLLKWMAKHVYNI